jgi:hypothetical protein
MSCTEGGLGKQTIYDCDPSRISSDITNASDTDMTYSTLNSKASALKVS